jgi:hypothetical protein
MGVDFGVDFGMIVKVPITMILATATHFQKPDATLPELRQLQAVPLAALLILIIGCGRDRPSGLDHAADSLAASVPLVADTVRSSGMVPRRLTLVTDTVIQPTPDSTAPNWLRSSSRMVVGRDFLAIFSAGNLKVFDHSGKHLWSTSRYEFSPGQAQSAKRPGAGSSVNHQ